MGSVFTFSMIMHAVKEKPIQQAAPRESEEGDASLSVDD